MLNSRIASRKLVAAATVSPSLNATPRQSCSTAEAQPVLGPSIFARVLVSCRWRGALRSGFLCLFVALFTCWVGTAPCAAQSVTFGGPVVGGAATTQLGGVTSSTTLLDIQNPAGIATNKLGTYYITDSTGNAVYSVINPSTPGFTPNYTKLNFSGLDSPAGVAVDGSGNVYVADYLNHRVVELPPGGSASQQTVPFTTTGDPFGVAVDGSGNLYVSVLFAPTAAGSVWKIAAGTHTQTQIGTGLFDPKGLAVDGSGNLYIADSQNSRIVEIEASGTQVTAVSGLNVPGNLAVDSAGNIFTDAASGSYEIEVKTGSTEQVAVLPAITGIYSGLAVDGNDNVFAVSNPTPTLYESNTKVISLPQANVCQTGGNPSTSCSSTISLVFWIWNSVDLGTPRILTQGTSGLDFTDGGSSAYSIAQGIPQPCAAGQITLSTGESETCSVTVKFTPQAAGPRSGAVQIVDSSGNVLAQLMLYGMGMGPQLSIAAEGATPVTTTVPVSAGNNTPSAVGVDAAGNVYITEAFDASSGYTSSIYKISPAGSQTVIPIANTFSPGRVEIDGAGDLYLPAGYGDYEFPPAGSATAPTPLLGNLHGATEGLSIDGLGNVNMVTDNFGLGTGTIYRSTLDGSLITMFSSSTNDGFGDIVDDPWLSAADTSGRYDNPIVADATSLDQVSPLEQSLVPYPLSVGFNVPQESGILGVSPGGDLYFSNGLAINDTQGRTVFPGKDGVAGPFAVDGSANLYIVLPATGSTAASVVEMPAIQQPFTFAGTVVGNASAAQVFTVFNSGNAAMNFTTISVSGPFALTSSTNCSTTAPLQPLGSCSIGVAFKPTAMGAATGNLTVAVAGLVTPTFTLLGTGESAPTLASTSTSLQASASTVTAGSSLTLTATVSSAAGSPSGEVTFDDGATVLGNASVNSGVATFSTDTLAAGTHSITATYSGDSSHASSMSAAVSVTIVPFSVMVAAPSSTSVAPGGSVTANVTVTSANNYAGTISLSCAVTYQGQGSSTDPPQCGVSPASVTVTAGGSGSATMTVTTSAETARLNPNASGRFALCGFGVGSIVLLCLFRRRSSLVAFLALVVLAHAALTGCNTPAPTPAPVTTSNPGTAAGTYQVTLTSTAGQAVTTQSFTITVQ